MKRQQRAVHRCVRFYSKYARDTDDSCYQSSMSRIFYEWSSRAHTDVLFLKAMAQKRQGDAFVTSVSYGAIVFGDEAGDMLFFCAYLPRIIPHPIIYKPRYPISTNNVYDHAYAFGRDAKFIRDIIQECLGPDVILRSLIPCERDTKLDASRPERKKNHHIYALLNYGGIFPNCFTPQELQ